MYIESNVEHHGSLTLDVQIETTGGIKPTPPWHQFPEDMRRVALHIVELTPTKIHTDFMKYGGKRNRQHQRKPRGFFGKLFAFVKWTLIIVICLLVYAYVSHGL